MLSSVPLLLPSSRPPRPPCLSSLTASSSLLAPSALLQYCGKGERDAEKEGGRKAARNSIPYQSGQCTAHTALIADGEGAGQKNTRRRGSVRRGWSIEISTWRIKRGSECFSAVLQSEREKDILGRLLFPCMNVSLSPPLAFPLIFYKQELRLSATGPQFVPTIKKNMATTPGRACSVPKFHLLSLHLLLEPVQIWQIRIDRPTNWNLVLSSHHWMRRELLFSLRQKLSGSFRRTGSLSAAIRSTLACLCWRFFYPFSWWCISAYLSLLPPTPTSCFQHCITYLMSTKSHHTLTNGLTLKCRKANLRRKETLSAIALINHHQNM